MVISHSSSIFSVRNNIGFADHIGGWGGTAVHARGFITDNILEVSDHERGGGEKRESLRTSLEVSSMSGVHVVCQP